MKIETAMQHRATLTEQMDATPVTDDASFNSIFDQRWQLENEILLRQAVTVDDLKAQIVILASRARDGGDVTLDLERLAV